MKLETILRRNLLKKIKKIPKIKQAIKVYVYASNVKKILK